MATPALIRYQHADLRLRIARARLLLQITGADRDVRLEDVLIFSRAIGDESAPDSLAAFRAAQEEGLRAAEAELARLPHE